MSVLYSNVTSGGIIFKRNFLLRIPQLLKGSWRPFLTHSWRIFTFDDRWSNSSPLKYKHTKGLAERKLKLQHSSIIQRLARKWAAHFIQTRITFESKYKCRKYVGLLIDNNFCNIKIIERSTYISIPTQYKPVKLIVSVSGLNILPSLLQSTKCAVYPLFKGCPGEDEINRWKQE